MTFGIKDTAKEQKLEKQYIEMFQASWMKSV